MIGRFLLKFLILISTSVVVYGQSTLPVNVSNVTKLRIDPQTAVPIKASDLFEEVAYIPLELNTQSSIGTVSKMEITEHRIIIYDRDTYSTLFFKSDGTFIKKLTPRQVGSFAGLSSAAPEGNVYNSFSVVLKDNRPTVLIASNKRFLYFDLDGSFIKAETELGDIPFMVFGDSTQLFRNYKDQDNLTYAYALVHNKEIKKFNKLSAARLATDELYSQGNGFYIARDKQSLLFVDYYSYDVHKVDASGSSLKYQFIFPASHSLPSDFMANDQYNGKRWDYFIEHKQAIYGMQNVVEVGDYLYFSLASYAPGNSEKKNLVLHRPSATLISLQHVFPDESTYFLPINDASYGSYFMRKGFTTYDDQHFYTVISPLSITKFDAENKERKQPYPEKLASSISKGAKGNPIVVRITPKKK